MLLQTLPKSCSTPKQNVEVYCRVRPIDDSFQSCVEVVNQETIKLFPPYGYQSSRIGASFKTVESTFTHVLAQDAAQKEVFGKVALDMVEDVIEGKNALMFTYGITGSGKTFTMTGTPEEPGLMLRIFDSLFNSLKANIIVPCPFLSDGVNRFKVASYIEQQMNEETRNSHKSASSEPYSRAPGRIGNKRGFNDELVEEEWKKRPCEHDTTILKSAVDEDSAYAIFVSYIEIYNDYVYDLLDNRCPPLSKKIKEDARGNMFPQNVIEEEVRDSDEVFDVFIRGQKNRRVAHTALNAESSRSHSIFTIKLVQAPFDETGKCVLQDDSAITCSQLSLVDLAGSERTARTGNVGHRLKETGNINKSLMVLRQCIDQLRKNQQLPLGEKAQIVRYRDQKLTCLFKTFFEGQGKIKMIVCVNPAAHDYEENFAVLDFAEATREVEVFQADKVQRIAMLQPGRRANAAFADFESMMNAMRQPRDDGMPKTSTPKESINFASLYKSPPRLQLQGSGDEMLCKNLNNWALENSRIRKIALEEIRPRRHRLMDALTTLVQASERIQIENDQLHRQLEDSNKECARLNGFARNLEHELKRVYERLNLYENTANDAANQQLQHKRREREMATVLKEKHHTMQKVREIFEHGSQVINSNRKSTSIDSVNGNQDADGFKTPRTIRSAQKFGGSVDQMSRTPVYGGTLQQCFIANSCTPTSSRKANTIENRPPFQTSNLTRKGQSPSRIFKANNGIPLAHRSTRRRSKSVGATVKNNENASKLKPMTPRSNRKRGSDSPQESPYAELIKKLRPVNRKL